jgi:hypothetical protein
VATRRLFVGNAVYLYPSEYDFWDFGIFICLCHCDTEKVANSLSGIAPHFSGSLKKHLTKQTNIAIMRRFQRSAIVRNIF